MGLTGEDVAHLERCLALADRGARTAAPNPLVGCLIVRDGVVLGEGWHERPGADHAEVAALRAAGDAAGATAYVSLEPCCHHGRTPPCTEALLDARVARVVVAALDPSSKVAGKGVAALHGGGVTVDVAEGEVAASARRQNAPFRTLVLLGRPHVTYKAAISLDGRTATPAGDSRWISSPDSRRLVHEMRARCGAVAVGAGTAVADDPLLTARDVEPPAEHQPLRVVFDRRARLPAESALARTAREVPVLVVCDPAAPDRPDLAALGVEVLTAAPRPALEELGRRGISSLLLEGGAVLAGALLAEELIDRLALFVAPLVIGRGPGVVDAVLPEGLAEAPRATGLRARAVGPDILLEAELREV